VKVDEFVAPAPFPRQSFAHPRIASHAPTMKSVSLACYFLATLISPAFQLPSGSEQCVVGVAEGWDSSHVTLSYFEKKGGIDKILNLGFLEYSVSNDLIIIFP
jgi:hypothetical protein